MTLSYLSPMGISSVAQADTSTNAPYTMIDDVNGDLIVQPGGHLAVASSIASLVTASVGIVWYEQPKQ